MFKAYRKTYNSETETYTRTLFYDDTSESDATKLTSAKLSLELGKAGTFTFTVPMTNSSYDRFELLETMVDVYRNEDLVFAGRVYEVKKNINGLLTIICEGMLAVLNDSVLEPQTFANLTVSQFVAELIRIHNTQVDAYKQITVGTITASTEYIYREYENHESIMQRFEDVVKTYGGYPQITLDNGHLRLDWLSEADFLAQTPNAQKIDFGVNMLSLDQGSNANTLLTVIYPIGADIEDGEEDSGARRKVDISDIYTALKPKGQPYIENAEAIAKYGRIVKVVEWSDVHDATTLYNKALKYLNDYCRGRLQLTVNAVDMAKAGSTVESYKLGDLTVTNAPVHGITNAEMLLLKQNLDLLNPASNKMQLGSVKVGFIGRSDTSGSSSAVDAVARQQASQAQQGVDDLNSTVEAINTGLNGQMADVNERVNEAVTSFDSFKSSENDRISAGIRQWYEGYVDEAGNVIKGEREVIRETYIEANGEWVGLVNEARGNIDNWLHFDTDGTLEIGRSNSDIVSRQDNDSYDFVDKSTNEVLLSLNGSKDETGYIGITSQTGQFDQTVYKRGGVPKWAVRVVDSDNLNFIWIG